MAHGASKIPDRPLWHATALRRFKWLSRAVPVLVLAGAIAVEVFDASMRVLGVMLLAAGALQVVLGVLLARDGGGLRTRLRTADFPLGIFFAPATLALRADRKRRRRVLALTAGWGIAVGVLLIVVAAVVLTGAAPTR